MNAKEKVEKWVREEIHLLRIAPEVNGCEMRREWKEQLEIMQTFLDALISPAHFDTCDLVDELKKREGVEPHIAEPHQDITVSVNGPAVVLVVID